MPGQKPKSEARSQGIHANINYSSSGSPQQEEMEGQVQVNLGEVKVSKTRCKGQRQNWSCKKVKMLYIFH